MITKSHIITEIKRTARMNGGNPLGRDRFQAETGIKTSDWTGKYWARWSDALVEAGYEPNALVGPRDEDDLLESLALFTRELGHFPVDNEIKLKARTEPGFPWHNTFARFGNKQALVRRLREYCFIQGYQDVVALCDIKIKLPIDSAENAEAINESELDIGHVYLMKSGRYYKIGRSNAIGRRERELAIQLPEKSKVVHSIKTDDPAGIERYWHERFKEKRKNGEWFDLISVDVASFKRRKFM
jgi:hypothetical protein